MTRERVLDAVRKAVRRCVPGHGNILKADLGSEVGEGAGGEVLEVARYVEVKPAVSEEPPLPTAEVRNRDGDLPARLQ